MESSIENAVHDNHIKEIKDLKYLFEVKRKHAKSLTETINEGLLIMNKAINKLELVIENPNIINEILEVENGD